MRYAVVIEKAGDNYSAYVPDLPGCIATGETVADWSGSCERRSASTSRASRRTDFRSRRRARWRNTSRLERSGKLRGFWIIGAGRMPTIAYFYGIAIQMFFADHNPPDFHARYGRAKAIVRIADGEIIAGELPPTAARLVREWALARRPQLEDNWRRGLSHEAMERIAGPDHNG